MLEDRDLEGAVEVLVGFLKPAPLTATIAELEHALDGCRQADLNVLLRDRGVSEDLLDAARLVREEFGRINDVIHAIAIALALPRLIAPGEMLRRPSLAAGNDPSRRYDIETDRRIAEFKLARWDGHDGMRKRQLVKDLVHLAADASGRSAELYVLGDRPLRFLKCTRVKVAWALDRFPATQKLFQERFGPTEVPIREFVAGPGARVNVVDLEERLPALFTPTSS